MVRDFAVFVSMLATPLHEIETAKRRRKEVWSSWSYIPFLAIVVDCCDGGSLFVATALRLRLKHCDAQMAERRLVCAGGLGGRWWSGRSDLPTYASLTERSRQITDYEVVQEYQEFEGTRLKSFHSGDAHWRPPSCQSR